MLHTLSVYIRITKVISALFYHFVQSSLNYNLFIAGHSSILQFTGFSKSTLKYYYFRVAIIFKLKTNCFDEVKF